MDKITNKRFLQILFFLILVVFFNAVSSKPVKRIILIGWDGVQREHFKEALGENQLPNINLLIKNGSLVDLDITGVTDTKAGWSEILTGYGPDKTGVYDNYNY